MQNVTLESIDDVTIDMPFSEMIIYSSFSSWLSLIVISQRFNFSIAFLHVHCKLKYCYSLYILSETISYTKKYFCNNFLNNLEMVFLQVKLEMIVVTEACSYPVVCSFTSLKVEDSIGKITNLSFLSA